MLPKRKPGTFSSFSSFSSSSSSSFFALFFSCLSCCLQFSSLRRSPFSTGGHGVWQVLAQQNSDLTIQKSAAWPLFYKEIHLSFRALNALTHSHLTSEDERSLANAAEVAKGGKSSASCKLQASQSSGDAEQPMGENP